MDFDEVYPDAKRNERYSWQTDSVTVGAKRPCQRCGRVTRWHSDIFAAPFCGCECLASAWNALVRDWRWAQLEIDKETIMQAAVLTARDGDIIPCEEMRIERGDRRLRMADTGRIQFSVAGLVVGHIEPETTIGRVFMARFA